MDNNSVKQPAENVNEVADFVMVITSVEGKRMVKRFDAAGELHPYDEGATWFSSVKKPVKDLDDLARVLDSVGPNSCIVLGELNDGVDPSKHRRTSRDKAGREPPSYREAKHRWLAIDLDVAGIGMNWLYSLCREPQLPTEVIERIPPELHGVRCHWRATSSTGYKDGLYLRLFYWLDRALTDAEMKAWMKPHGVDKSIYQAQQPIYVGAPIFEDGAEDPLIGYGFDGERSGFKEGPFHDVVKVPEIKVPERVHQEAPEGLTEDDDDPVLASAAGSIIERITSKKAGSGDTGETAKKIVGALGAMRTGDGKILSHDGIVEHMFQNCDWLDNRDAVADMVERLLDGKPRGNMLVDEYGNRIEGFNGFDPEPYLTPADEPQGVGIRRNRFGGRTPEADATLLPITYWDNNKTLPRGCGLVGMVIGDTGSHKTGVMLMHGLDAIERHNARVLYIAAEGAHGIKSQRLPKARELRDMPWAKLNEHWRTESETFDILSREDNDLLYDAYGEWAPNLIFVDVLTLVTSADINTPKGSRDIMSAANALAQRFEATVVIAHHPGKDPSKGAMGCRLLKSLADFEWSVWPKDGAVWVKVTKMKDGQADLSHSYVADMTLGPPVIRAPKVSEVMAERGTILDPLALAIKEVLDKEPASVFDMSGLIERLGGAIGDGIKHPNKIIVGLIADGQLAGYVRTTGSGNGTRHTFQKQG
jgi:hypothetical protein